MEKFVKGDIVVIPFPFSDLSGTKRRPALVLSDLQGDDISFFKLPDNRQRINMLYQ